MLQNFDFFSNNKVQFIDLFYYIKNRLRNICSNSKIDISLTIRSSRFKPSETKFRNVINFNKY